MSDNFVLKEGTGTNRNILAKDVGSNILAQGILLTDQNGNWLPGDNEAAAGPIFPMAGVYQSAPSSLGDGNVGRVRASSRRGLVTSDDTKYVNHYLAGADFDTRDQNFHNIDVGVASELFKSIIFGMKNELDQSLEIIVRHLWPNQVSEYPTGNTLFTDTIPASTGGLALAPSAGGTGSSSTSVPVLGDGLWVVRVYWRANGGVNPTSGSFFLESVRSS